MNHSLHPTIPATNHPAADTERTPCASTWRCSPALASMTLAEPDLRRTREEARRYQSNWAKWLPVAERVEKMAAKWERLRVVETTGVSVDG